MRWLKRLFVKNLAPSRIVTITADSTLINMEAGDTYDIKWAISLSYDPEHNTLELKELGHDKTILRIPTDLPYESIHRVFVSYPMLDSSKIKSWLDRFSIGEILSYLREERGCKIDYQGQLEEVSHV